MFRVVPAPANGFHTLERNQSDPGYCFDVVAEGTDPVFKIDDFHNHRAIMVEKTSTMQMGAVAKSGLRAMYGRAEELGLAGAKEQDLENAPIA